MKRTFSLLMVTLLLVSMFTAASGIRAAETGFSQLTSPNEPAAVKENMNYASEPPSTEWNKTYGGTNADYAQSVVRTSDGGYALTGYTSSYGAGGGDSWLVKTDADGTLMWNKTYGGPDAEIAYALLQTGDGGYAIVGMTNSLPIGQERCSWLVKTDANGNAQWNRTYGGTDWIYAQSVVQTSDGGYALAGYTDPYQNGYPLFWMAKMDANGNEQWNQTYGETNAHYAQSVVQTSDGGYALAGSQYSNGPLGNKGDFWLGKTDADGTLMWNRTYGGTDTDYAWSVVQTSDGGYALAGWTASFGAGGNDFWLVKTDSAGSMLWNKTYGGIAEEMAFSVVRTSDGGYALAGLTSSYGMGSYDSWLVKTDANGNEQWDETYGGTDTEFAYSMVQADDGGYALAGQTASFGAGERDFWLVKTAPDSWAGGTIYIRADGSIDPPTAPIQRDGDVYTLTGDISSDALVDGIVIERDNVILDGAGYTIQEPGLPNYGNGFDCSDINNVTIRNTNIEGFYHGIYLYSSSNNSIYGNNITNNDYGIKLTNNEPYYSNYNSMIGNNITNNDYGIVIRDYCSYNSIIGNSITANIFCGVAVAWESNHNSICGNNIADNEYYGINLANSSYNYIYHNSFVNNTPQVYDNSWTNPEIPPSINTWDDGYPSGGNYWSDYSDADLYSGLNQNEPGSDGIWDHPYVIDADNQDHYPLVEPWTQTPARIKGIDVSEFQCGPPLINWTEVHYSGVEFAYVRATLGDNKPPTYVDENFTFNMVNAKEAGLLVGAYHVAYADRNNAIDEAEFFLSVAGNYTKAGYLRPMLDLEQEILNNIMAEKGLEEGKLYLQAWVEVWASKVESETGQVPILYMGKYAAANYFNESFEKYDLWIADLTNDPTGSPDIGIWDTWSFWQYSWTGTVTGIVGDVDLDLFNGDLQDLYRHLVIPIPGDANRDRNVDIFDCVIVALAFSSTPSDPNWNPVADINNDGIVDIFDIVVVALHFGETG